MMCSAAALGVVVSITLGQASQGDRILEEFGNRFAGRWTSSATVDGRTVRATTTFTWGVGRRSLVMETRVPGVPPMEHTTLIGWNPDKNLLTSVAFHTDGGATLGKITRVGRDGKTWVHEIWGANPDGVEVTLTNTYTFFGTTAFKAEPSEVRVKGLRVEGILPTLLYEKR